MGGRGASGFAFDGVIVDVDESLPYQPHHPSAVVLIDLIDEIVPVIVPASAVGDKLPLLCAGRPVHVGGTFEKYEGLTHRVATRLRLLDRGH